MRIKVSYEIWVLTPIRVSRFKYAVPKLNCSNDWFKFGQEKTSETHLAKGDQFRARVTFDSKRLVKSKL